MSLADEGWSVEFHSGIPVYRQIMHQVQAAISAGRLAPGDQLPTIRALHLQLKVNPNTVAKAYRELELAGVIAATQGRGSFVAPPAAVRRVPLRERKAKLGELAARFAAEARSHGFSIEEVLQHVNQRKSHV